MNLRRWYHRSHMGNKDIFILWRNCNKKMKRIRLLTSMLILSMVLTNSAFAVPEPERGKDIFVEQCVATAVTPKAMYSKQIDYKGTTVSNEGGYCQIELMYIQRSTFRMGNLFLLMMLEYIKTAQVKILSRCNWITIIYIFRMIDKKLLVLFK